MFYIADAKVAILVKQARKRFDPEFCSTTYCITVNAEAATLILETYNISHPDRIEHDEAKGIVFAYERDKLVRIKYLNIVAP